MAWEYIFIRKRLRLAAGFQRRAADIKALNKKFKEYSKKLH